MADAGVTITVAPPRSMAVIGAFRDQPRLLAALRQEFGTEIPVTPRCMQAGAFTVSCLAPGRFCVSGARDADLPARLAASLAGLGAVTDQSDMWMVIVVSGAEAREVLSKIVPVDVGDEQFREGEIALTRAGHLDVQLSRIATQTYELAVTRSFAPSLVYALKHASNQSSLLLSFKKEDLP